MAKRKKRQTSSASTRSRKSRSRVAGDKTPNTLTIEWLQRKGFIAELTERMIPRRFIKLDLFGCIDMVAVKKDGSIPGTVFVQATSEGHIRDRVRKVKANPNTSHLLNAGNEVWIVGWRKKKVKGVDGAKMLTKPIVKKLRKKQ